MSPAALDPLLHDPHWGTCRPHLEPVETYGTGPVRHEAVEGDNLRALHAMSARLAGHVDCIYVDAPYNTGTDFSYDDRRGRGAWLDFMRDRLIVARDLMAGTGVLIVAIDDAEHAHLRILLDELMGERNYLATVVWQGARQNNARYVAVSHDYMLMYARDERALRALDVKWRETKPGVEDVLAAGAVAWHESDGDAEAATLLLKAWFRALPDGHPALTAGNYNYNRVDETGRVFYADNMAAPRHDGGTQPLRDPVTGLWHAAPRGGWRYSPARLAELVTDDLVYFRAGMNPLLKRYLDEYGTWGPESVFYTDRRRATRRLTELLGARLFTYPKDERVLARWIDLVTAHVDEPVILDFFAGSGSTLHAVVELNAVDDGSRRCVLVTNNEVDPKVAAGMSSDGLVAGDPGWELQGTFRRVLQPRLQALMAPMKHGRRQHVTVSRLVDVPVTRVEERVA